VKEVGAGISRADAERLIQAGVKVIDVAGAGGTSWSRIEAARSADPSLGELFQDWGLPTPMALKQLAPLGVTLIASGGIRTGIDMAKAIILGASLCGIARPFLNPAMESVEAVRAVIQKLKREFVTALFLLGADRVEKIKGREELIIQDLKTYERTQETLAFLELIRQGDEDVEAGQTVPMKQAFAELRKEIRKKNPESKL
jgi:isopentenyl-diphosphate Delta-isomerase